MSKSLPLHSFFYTVTLNDFHRIFLDFGDFLNQCCPCFCIEHFYKCNRLIKWRFLQIRHIIHISILFNMVNDFHNKCNLLLIQRRIIDKSRECVHSRIVVQLCNFTNQQTKGRILKFSCIILLTAQFICQDTFQFRIVSNGKGNPFSISQASPNLIFSIYLIPINLTLFVQNNLSFSSATFYLFGLSPSLYGTVAEGTTVEAGSVCID